MLRATGLIGVIVLSSVVPLVLAAGPTTAPGVLEFPAEQVSIPLMRAGDYFFVRGRINGQDAGLFLLDTGASQIAVDRPLAARLGLQYVAASQAGTTGGNQATVVHAIDSFSIDGVTLHRTFATVLDLSRFSDEFKLPLAGIVGGNFFSAVPFRFSSREATLTLYKRPAFTPPAQATRSGLRMIGARPYIWTNIEGSMANWFLIDTGATGPMILDSIFAQLHQEDLIDRPWTREFAMGIGGLEDVRKITFSRVETMGQQFEQVAAGFSVERPQPGRFVAGHLSMPILGHFDLTFDYQQLAIWSMYHSRPTPVEWQDADFDPAATDLAGGNALHRAARKRWTDEALRFVEAGVDVNAQDYRGFRALHFAAAYGNGTLTRALLEAGSRRTCQGESGLYSVAFCLRDIGSRDRQFITGGRSRRE